MFYESLFEAYPSTRTYFENTDIVTQRSKLLLSLVLIIDSLRTPNLLQQYLQKMGKLHMGDLAIPRYHFDAVLEILLSSLESFLGNAWTNELENAWREAYQTIVDLMEQH